MRIEFENIVLRHIIESDIEDYVHWFTTETEWTNTDAPWEPIQSDGETERTSWREYYKSVRDLPNDVRRWKHDQNHASSRKFTFSVLRVPSKYGAFCYSSLTIPCKTLRKYRKHRVSQ